MLVYRDVLGYEKFQLKVGCNPDEDIERIKHVRSILDKNDILVDIIDTYHLNVTEKQLEYIIKVSQRNLKTAILLLEYFAFE